MSHQIAKWPIYIREWRKHRELSLEELSEEIEAVSGYAVTYATLSRIERGKIGYSRAVLEAIAEV